MSEYTSAASDLLKSYGTVPEQGLSREQAEEYLSMYGENRLQEGKKRGLLQKILTQFRDAMVLVLIVAAAVSFAVAIVEGTGEYIDSIIILAIVILNAALGVRQESKAEHALAALQELSAPAATVLRGGVVERIPALQVVPGDVVLLEAGDTVPADGILLESVSLRCDESALTGESVPAEKDAWADVEPSAALGDQRHRVFTGCDVSYGRARVLVTETGMNTEMGKIAVLLQDPRSGTTPLQEKLGRLGKVLGVVAIAVCAVIFALGLYQGLDPMVMFMTAVSLAVAVIPEGLTAVVTVVLALGVQRMVDHNAIIRRLPAVETLGSASVICSDKTGTLTQNRMTVQKIWPAGGRVETAAEDLGEKALHVLRLATLCSDGRVEVVDGEEHSVGDPTETAIVAAALRNGLEKDELESDFPRIAEIPFDSDRKRMSTVHTVGGRNLVIVKGGFDGMASLCPELDRGRAEAVNVNMAKEGLRVLAVACRELDDAPETADPEVLETGLRFMGLIGMIDPPREESARAVALCREAGIRTVMITGDHVVTAAAIASDLGILEDGSQALTGKQLAKMSDEQLREEVDRYRVYARVSPTDKIRIVEAWQSRGDVVAMTGDGVNDAPALKAADIGCAMGITGTDVAKGAADMVLTDDNFSTIVEAVRSGRGIYDNIRKTVQFLLSCNLGEVLVVFVAMMLGWGTPLLAIHLLLINVVTDALPALALGVEPVEKNIMKRKPVPKSQGVFAEGMGAVIALQGVMIGALTLAGYYIGANTPLSAFYAPSAEMGMTMAFLVLALSQLTQAMNCRSRQSLFTIGFASNKKMLWSVLGSAAVVAAICLVPPLESLFRLVDLSMNHWLAVVGLSLAPLVIVEAAKGVLRLRRKSKRLV